MRVEISAGARNDLRNIALFIATDSITHALRFYDELEAACFSLAQFPERHPIIFNKKGAQVRCRTYGRYLIYYKADLEVVQILRVIHSAKDQENMLL